jgi:hypothetical protein
MCHSIPETLLDDSRVSRLYFPSAFLFSRSICSRFASCFDIINTLSATVTR